jgi:beta-xylosidase
MNTRAARPQLLLLALTILPLAASTPAADAISGRAPHSANPILPGYYADPSVVQDGGKSYIYATLDPWGDKTLGCWESADFKNWTYRELNWPTKQECTSPTSKGAGVWAPSVMKGPDGKFHMVISVGSEVWVGVADHPLGPWRNALGGRQPLIPYHYKPGFHMIDAEYFLDDDGQAYLYWGSGHGWVNGKCWLVKLKSDLATFDGEVKDVTPANYFEGPLMLKRHGLYFLMYSSGKTIEENYQVHYAVGKSPHGPFVEGPGSPVLVTDKSRNISSPGHHTLFQRDGADYILYHRHSIPFDPKFIGRQICVDPIVFTADGRIERIKPTHQGPPLVQGRAESQSKLTSGANFTASSEATGLTAAAGAFDANYATRWAAAPGAKGAWLQIDLGAVQPIKRQLLRPEYAWKPQRFALEASADGKAWQRIADHTRDPVVGSPLVIEKNFSARFLRLVFPGDVKGSDISLIEWSLF